MSDILDTLRQEGVDPALLTAVQEYRAAHPLSEALRPRIPAPAFTYYGKEVWEQALAAILCGENLLLAGGKATGKNVLAENLAAAFAAGLSDRYRILHRTQPLFTGQAGQTDPSGQTGSSGQLSP